jgi:iron complex transport system substrate-binding protein
VFLVAIPGIAAGQTTQKVVSTITTALEDDFVLGIYGNANEDDTIDMRDLTYVKLIFFGKKPETELADAKYDGKINPLDFVRIKLIIVGKEKELTIVDSTDRIVTVKKPLERIVTHHTGAVEVMRSLGLEKDRIAGVSDYVIEDEVFFPEFCDYPSTGKWPADVEKILSLTPDVVFLYASYQKDEREKLEDAGITVLCFDLYIPGDIYVEEIEKLGYIIDNEEEAKKFVEFHERYLNTVKERVEELSEEDKPTVYFEWGPYKTCGEGAGYHEEIALAGGNNIFSNISGYPTVDPEEVIKCNPDVVVIEAHEKSGYESNDITQLTSLRDEIMSRPELAEVTAVKQGRVYVISGDLYGGVQHFISIGYLAKWFYPSLFEDLDPKAIHQEYLTRFQGLGYDLGKHGTFVYPAPS